jgi:WD40 repeat protein
MMGEYKPVWSPDGKRIAFFSDRGGNFDIWLMNADGSDMQQLTKDPKPDRYPTFSPDGKRIAFSSWRNGVPNLYMMNIDGSDVHQITYGTGGDFEPYWSPNKDEIAFFSKRSDKYEIWKVNADGTGLRQITHYDGMYMGAWLPDGSRILCFDNAHNIFLVDNDGNITGILSLELNLWHPIVSNNNERILFETVASFLPNKTPDEIVIIEAKMPAVVKRKEYQQQFGYLIPEGYEIINVLQEDTNNDSIPELIIGIQGKEDENGEVSKPSLLLIFEKQENKWVEVWRFHKQDKYGGNCNYFGYWGHIGLMDGILDKSLRVMDINNDGRKDLFFVTTDYGMGSGYRSYLNLYSWEDKTSTYIPLTTTDIDFGAWSGRPYAADGLAILDVDPQYNGKEIILARYIYDDTLDELAGWEIFFYGWKAGSYNVYKQIKTPIKCKDAGEALRNVIGLKPLLFQNTNAR